MFLYFTSKFISQFYLFLFIFVFTALTLFGLIRATCLPVHGIHCPPYSLQCNCWKGYLISPTQLLVVIEKVLVTWSMVFFNCLYSASSQEILTLLYWEFSFSYQPSGLPISHTLLLLRCVFLISWTLNASFFTSWRFLYFIQVLRCCLALAALILSLPLFEQAQGYYYHVFLLHCL